MIASLNSEPKMKTIVPSHASTKTRVETFIDQHGFARQKRPVVASSDGRDESDRRTMSVTVEVKPGRLTGRGKELSLNRYKHFDV